MNVYYLKKGNEKIYLENIIPEDKQLKLELRDLKDLDEIKTAFSGLSDVTIYTAIVQEDGRETDEIVHQYFANLTKLSNIAYDISADRYTVTLIEPDEIEERVLELEDAVNYILFGGE